MAGGPAYGTFKSRGCPIQALVGRGCSSITDHLARREVDLWSALVPEALPESGQNHSLTFSCYHRQPKLDAPAPRDLFVKALETVRQQYGLLVYGFVVMPEHVH